jgi:hypothetical protein
MGYMVIINLIGQELWTRLSRQFAEETTHRIDDRMAAALVRRPSED